MPSEIIIKLKNEEKSTTYKYLEYETVTTSDDDEIIKRYLDDSFTNFCDEVEKQSITIKLIRS